MNALRVIRMNESHIPAVRDIELRAFQSTWPEDAFITEVRRNRSARYLVVCEAEDVLGYVGIWLVEDEAHITSIAVDPERRGQRLGSKLLYCMIELCRQEGARWITLEVRDDNEVALRMYRRFGFARVGRRKKYYKGGQDALVMWAGNLQSQSYGARLERLRSTWEPNELKEDF